MTLSAAGEVCWLDLGVVELEATAAFYGELFGWTVAEPDPSGYRLASLDGRLVAAFGPADDPGPPYWTVYLHTADIAATLTKVSAAGGAIVAPPSPAGDAGVAAVVRDPHGGPLSFWQPGDHKGTDTSGQHGTFAGVSLRTDDNQAFLHAVVGWEPRPDATMTLDGRTVATRAPGPVTASPWLVRFLVTDVASTAEKAARIGASRLDGEPSVLVDPAGALFGVTQIS